jgi:type III pantothenate kinase
MDLVLDIGSTETTVGLFEGQELRKRWRLASDRQRTADESALLLRQLLRDANLDPRGLMRVTYASVMPAVAAALASACEHALHLEAVAIDARVPLPIRIDVDEPLGVGADRLVNAAAAHASFARNAIVVDLGTATTYDCVTADGAFVGGAIAPGLRTGAERLIERTARLPRVALTEPERVIGRRTEACLQSGIFFGAVDAVDGMVRRIRAEWGRPNAVVVATGGLATLVAPHCSTVQQIDPDLTLHGIRLCREHLDRARAPSPEPLRGQTAVPTVEP